MFTDKRFCTMGKQEDDIESRDIGDHAGHTKSEDLLFEADSEEEFVQVYMSTWPGPYLSFLEALDPDSPDRVLEVWVSHPKGLLLSSILPREKDELIEFDPWLREIVCRINLVDSHPVHGKHTYLTRIFVKLPKQDGPAIEEVPSSSKRPLIEDKNIRPDFDRCPMVDTTGVRGHARGLVSKALLDRLDGVQAHDSSWPMNSKAHELHSEFWVYPDPSVVLPANFQAPSLNNTNTACLATLLDDLFRRAKSLELELQVLNTPVKSYGYPHEWTEDMPTHETGRLRFCDAVSVIPIDDDCSKPSADLFSKVTPEHSILLFASLTAELPDTQSLNAEYYDAQSTTAVLPSTGSFMAEYQEAEYTIAVLPATENATAENRQTEFTTAVLPGTEYPQNVYTTVHADLLPGTGSVITEYPEAEYTVAVLRCTQCLSAKESEAESRATQLPGTESHTAEFHDAMSTTAVLQDTESLTTEYHDARSTLSVIPDTESRTDERPGPESTTAELSNTESPVGEKLDAESTTAKLPTTESLAVKKLEAESTTTELPGIESLKPEERPAPSENTGLSDIDSAGLHSLCKLPQTDSLTTEHMLNESNQPNVESASTKCLVDIDSLAAKSLVKESDSHKPTASSRWTRLRTFLTGLLCCMPVRRREKKPSQ